MAARGVSDWNTQNKAGMTPVMLAASHGNRAVTERFLSQLYEDEKKKQGGISTSIKAEVKKVLDSNVSKVSIRPPCKYFTTNVSISVAVLSGGMQYKYSCVYGFDITVSSGHCLNSGCSPRAHHGAATTYRKWCRRQQSE